MVTTERDEAAQAAAAGQGKVLVVRPDAEVVAVVAGRLAVLVGDPDDPATQAAATAMEGELFAATTRGGAAAATTEP